MKKVIAILLVLAMVFALAACGTPANNTTPANQNNTNGSNTNNTTPEKPVYNVGMVCIGDENAAYDRNFYMAADAAKAQLAKEGIDINWIYTYHHPEGKEVADDCEELAGEKNCIAVFLNSYGQEPAMLQIAADYPKTVFAGLTNEGSYKDKLDNTINAFPSIYEGRYLAGVAAGCKLNEMIADGTITADKAVIGYVGAYTFAEVVSGYTAFFLGARSVCPTATMIVKFIGSWGDPTMEAATAKDLIDNGAVLISQHSDSTTPATTAQENKVFHVGYNISMSGSDVAPNASIISSRIDWTNFFVKVI
ncbi:MAG: BMP family ABC transporter substrate-binding protein, partial [Firmicutes bacterium]|nr:BMP family ABC transporter substrate-binding protein [Bacillota bacterium]